MHSKLPSAPDARTLTAILLTVLTVGCEGWRSSDNQVASPAEPAADDVTATQSAITILPAPAPAPAPPATPAPPTANPAAKKTVWLLMKDRPNLAVARATRDWKGRGQQAFATLNATAGTSQASVRAFLAARGVAFKPFWIINTVKVTADQATIDELAKRSDVAKVVPDTVYKVPPAQKATGLKAINDVEWNLINIRAPEVWEGFGAQGDGIVVGSIDTGVQFDHPALVRQYRGNLGDGNFDHNYNWFDPANICGFPSLAPCDNVFHGTHTMGTMVGDDQAGNQIGVAPHAKWIAAKGCETDSCSTESLLAAGQWILAPTDLNGQNPRPELRPQVVNNSWGAPFHDDFFHDVVTSWVAAGIFPAFANGNSGSSCGSTGSPADYPESYSVGAYDIDNLLAFFSSRGPALDGSIKPNISAPGVNVRSSVPGGGYEAFNGTSMATPHLAGTVALLWSAAPALFGDVDGTRAILDLTAIDTEDLSCGGDAGNNNGFGQGRLDAFEAVNQAPRGPTGTLFGVVSTASGDPIVGAVVRAAGTADRRTRTDSTGAYKLVLPEGTYDVTASAFGYITQTVAGVAIVVDASVEQSFSLAAAPSFAVSGTVRDSGGRPIPGVQVSILGTPIPATRTDADGRYAFPSVPSGDYQVSAQAGGCYDGVVSPLTVDSDEVLDFTLPQKTDAFGYSCSPTSFNFVEANTVLPLFGQFGGISVPLPFPFPFYGVPYTTANISTNGFLSFQPLPFFFFSHGPIPGPDIPNAAVYPFWDDNMFVDGLASVRTETVGTAPNRQFVIEWRDVSLFTSPGRVRFEIVLSETSGQILTQYHTAEPDPAQRGAGATVGIENDLGSIALQYSFNQEILASSTAVLYTVPPSGTVQGTVTDANDATPIAGATVSLQNNGTEVRSASTDAKGQYSLFQVPAGSYVVNVTKSAYASVQANVTVAVNATTVANFALKTARASLTPATVQLIVPANQTRTRTLTLSSSGTIPLEFTVNETGGGRQNITATARIARNPIINPSAPNTRSLFATGLTVSGMAPLAAGDVISSFAPAGVSTPWGIGLASNLWVGDLPNRKDTEFITDGTPTGLSFLTPWAGAFSADMAYVPGRGLLCQVDVGADNGIHCMNPSTGDVVATIAGGFPWTAISQRGLAYRADDDSFYIGGWNEGIVYHIQGLGGANPGQVIGTCRPADGNISGLAYNGSVGVLWAATNSPTDTIYELNPDDCTVLSTLAHPQPFFNGAGLEMDDVGNLWTVSQGGVRAYLIDSGVPAFTDVPWLSVTPTSGTIASGGKRDLKVTVDTKGLTPGLYLASLFIRTNAAKQGVIRVPVSLLVPDYQQAANAGGNATLDTLGDTWAADRKYTTGQWGYVQKGKTASTTHAITGTPDQTLFKSQHIDPYAYRFDKVPNGTYQVDLRFAELANVKLGRRLFDVILEDSLVLPAHDIMYEVGRYAAESRTFFVEVTDGQMDLRLIPRAGYELPVINAVRVTHRVDR